MMLDNTPVAVSTHRSNLGWGGGDSASVSLVCLVRIVPQNSYSTLKKREKCLHCDVLLEVTLER